MVLNELDRFHPVMNVITCFYELVRSSKRLKYGLNAKLLEHKCHIQHGEDMPQIRDWVWGLSNAAVVPIRAMDKRLLIGR